MTSSTSCWNSLIRARRRWLAVSTSEDERKTLRARSEEHTSELQSRENHVCRLLLEKKTEGQLRRGRDLGDVRDRSGEEARLRRNRESVPGRGAVQVHRLDRQCRPIPVAPAVWT